MTTSEVRDFAAELDIIKCAVEAACPFTISFRTRNKDGKVIKSGGKPYVAHFCVGTGEGNGMHIDIDVAKKKYAMLCDTSTTSTDYPTKVATIFRKLGYERSGEVGHF